MTISASRWQNGPRSRRWPKWPYAFPALLISSLFIIFPIAYNFWSSLQQGGQGSGGSGLGLKNYSNLGSDAVFWEALKNTLIWVAVSTAVELLIGFAFALVLEGYIGRGKAIFRTLFFMPVVISPSVVAIIFVSIYAPSYGLGYSLFHTLGLHQDFPDIIGNPATATYAVMSAQIWQWAGFFALMMAVTISQIDVDLLEGAMIDGAKVPQLVRRVIVPLVRPTIFGLILVGTIQALQQFPLVFLITNGGPANSSQVLGTYIYITNFVEDRGHYAAAISMVFLVVALVLAGGIVLLARGRVSVGGGEV